MLSRIAYLTSWPVRSGSFFRSAGEKRGAVWLSTTTPSPETLTIVRKGDSSEYKKEVADILQDYDERKQRRQALVGVIVSDKNHKTISVQVLREKFFPKYNKVLSARRKIMAHDEEEIGKIGDVVRIVPCAPKSRHKRHRIIDVLKRSQV